MINSDVDRSLLSFLLSATTVTGQSIFATSGLGLNSYCNTFIKLGSPKLNNIMESKTDSVKYCITILEYSSIAIAACH